MLPAGLGFNAVSDEALAAASEAELPARLLGLGADHRGQPGGLLALHLGHEPALRARRGDRDAARGGAARRLRASPAPRRGHAPRGARLGPGGPLSGRARALRRTDRRADARRPRRRRAAARDPRALRHVARRRARAAARPRLSHRPPRRLQRPDAGRDALRRRDGPAGRRRARAAGSGVERGAGPGSRRRRGGPIARVGALAGLRVLELTPGYGRPVLRAGAGRHGRRRDQGRAARQRRPGAPRDGLHDEGRGHGGVPGRQPQQAQRGARPQARTHHREALYAPGRRRRRAAGELPAGRRRAARASTTRRCASATRD